MAATITQTATHPPTHAHPVGTLKLKPQQPRPVPQEDWRQTLEREGWVVVKGVIPKETALAYADKAYDFVESFGLGFSRNDPSTWTLDKMPFFAKGGLFHKYGASHEQFIWDIKQDPALVEKFAELWGTHELVCSYDGFNVSVPVAGRSEDDIVFKPWPHVDQSPLVPGLHCVQGILNLLPNGPQDGGLMLMKGSKALYSQLFEAFDDQKPERGWNARDRHDHSPEQIQWLIDHGCEYHKVCAEPGDLLLWDSRTVHYGATPESTNPRVAAYVCYKPASHLTEETKAKRRDAWAKKQLTSHDPITCWIEKREPPPQHHTANHWRVTTLQEPVLTPLGRKLAGVEEW